MNSHYKFFGLLLLLLSCTLGFSYQASDVELVSTDREAIEKVLNSYFEGWLTGDAEMEGNVMHSSCQLKFIRDGKVSIRDKENYLGGFKLRPMLPNAEGRIILIDITRNAAAAKIELETEQRLFTDYFNLLKVDNHWYITNKVSTSIAKE
jgi:hypothetical protein